MFIITASLASERRAATPSALERRAPTPSTDIPSVGSNASDGSGGSAPAYESMNKGKGPEREGRRIPAPPLAIQGWGGDPPPFHGMKLGSR